MASVSSSRAAEVKNLIPGKTGNWEVVIGMEVHAQIKSESKLFSGASAKFGAGPNESVSFVDAAMPGMLPVLNEKCVEQAIKTGLGLKAKINLISAFDRKNYFYPDLPQGYQISQFYHPIVGEGSIIVTVGPDKNGDFEDVEIGIERLHLEQDAGKSLHDQNPTMSYVDLNRCGVGLMEIVSKPDLRSAEEAKAYLTKLRAIMRYLDSCDGNMEEGSMRADVNVSVRKVGEALGERCEIKNVNSIRFVGQAINAEAKRQIALLESGQKIVQETRLFDPVKGETRTMRTKEDAQDYRYFPEPDLPPLSLSQSYIDEIAANLPELPDDIRKRLITKMGLTPYDASILVSEKTIYNYFEIAAKDSDAKLIANWVINDLLGALNKASLNIEYSPIAPKQLRDLVNLINNNIISGKIAKDVFEIMWDEGGCPVKIVEERGLKQITDTGFIAEIIDKIIASNTEKVDQLATKPALLGWFVGQTIKETQGKANPKLVTEMLKEKLKLV